MLQELLRPVIAVNRAAGTPESLEVARQAEVEIESHRLLELQTKDKLTAEEAGEQRILQAGQETRDALEDAGLEAKDVTPAAQAPLPSGAPGPLLLTADAVREFAKSQPAGEGEEPTASVGEDVAFASPQAEAAAEDANLEAKDFEGKEGTGEDGAFTKGDVDKIAGSDE